MVAKEPGCKELVGRVGHCMLGEGFECLERAVCLGQPRLDHQLLVLGDRHENCLRKVQVLFTQLVLVPEVYELSMVLMPSGQVPIVLRHDVLVVFEVVAHSAGQKAVYYWLLVVNKRWAEICIVACWT